MIFVAGAGINLWSDNRLIGLRADGGQGYAVPRGGLFEPRNVVGDVVKAGETCGFLHFIEDVDTPPIEVKYNADGILWMSAGPGRVQRGDCVGVAMQDYDDEIAAQG